MRRVAGLLVATFFVGCSSTDAATTTSPDPGGPTTEPTKVDACATDPLRTGIVAQQTGVSADAFDCEILKWSTEYLEPDPMLFKALIYAESRFDMNAAGCPNLPCGTPSGWTSEESGCFGLMQVVLACGGTPHGAGLLPDGHPNLTQDKAASAWAGSIFNPTVNIEVGIAGFAGNRAEAKKQFPGCTVDQYTMMAMGNYASYGSTKSCTVYNTDYAKIVLPTYQEYAKAAGYVAHAY